MDALAFQILLKSDTIKLPDIKRFLGKQVVITVAEVEPKKNAQERLWKNLGIANLQGRLDAVNIRELAYE